MATSSGISLIKRLSLIFSSKAFLLYANGQNPSLLVPVPTIDKNMKKAIYKTFADLTNDDVAVFGKGKLLENAEQEVKTKLNVDTVNLPKELLFESVEGVQIRPDSLFLTVNQEDNSLSFMDYADIQGHTLNTKTKPGQALRDGEKPQKQPSEKKVEKEEKNIKGPAREQHHTGQPLEKEHPGQKNQKTIIIEPRKKPQNTTQTEEFKDQVSFEKKEMSTWNEESPQLSTPAQKQPKEDISDLRTNKFIPLAVLSNNFGSEGIKISHIQTSRQYLLLQILKVFCMMNILCVYGLVSDWSRSENHENGKKKIL